jgi:hypothetical protein
MAELTKAVATLRKHRQKAGDSSNIVISAAATDPAVVRSDRLSAFESIRVGIRVESLRKRDDYSHLVESCLEAVVDSLDVDQADVRLACEETIRRVLKVSIVDLVDVSLAALFVGIRSVRLLLYRDCFTLIYMQADTCWHFLS